MGGGLVFRRVEVPGSAVIVWELVLCMVCPDCPVQVALCDGTIRKKISEISYHSLYKKAMQMTKS